MTDYGTPYDDRRAAEIAAYAYDRELRKEQAPTAQDTAKVGMKRIYIAGPYTAPDPCINTHDAIWAANTLIDLGFTPFIPHLAHFWHTISPKPYEVWTEWDNEWLKVCEAVYRIPGESPGADAEVKLAESLGIPVYYKMKDLLVRP